MALAAEPRQLFRRSEGTASKDLLDSGCDEEVACRSCIPHQSPFHRHLGRRFRRAPSSCPARFFEIWRHVMSVHWECSAGQYGTQHSLKWTVVRYIYRLVSQLHAWPAGRERGGGLDPGGDGGRQMRTAARPITESQTRAQPAGRVHGFIRCLCRGRACSWGWWARGTIALALVCSRQARQRERVAFPPTPEEARGGWPAKHAHC